MMNFYLYWQYKDEESFLWKTTAKLLNEKKDYLINKYQIYKKVTERENFI